MFELMINKRGEYCKKLLGAGRPKVMDDDSAIYEIKTMYKVSWEEAAVLLQQAKENAQNKYQQSASDEISIDNLIKEAKIFDKFLIVKNIVTGSAAVYYDKDTNGRDFVSTLVDFDAETIENYLSLNQRGLLTKICEFLKPVLNPKKTISNKDMLDACINVLNPKDTLPVLEISVDPHPASVEGTEVFSVLTIPFTPKIAALGDLNPFLAEFLGRVSSHEHLCAVLWTNLIGLKTPYVIYLQGSGGDGKSGFIEMLKILVRGSYSSFDMERFNGYNMYNKSLLVLNENNSINIMQNRIVKEVSGGDNMKIEGKGKNAFTGSIRGQIIIISNNQPKIQGVENEKRRLRYHTVKSHKLNNSEVLLPDRYIKELTSTPNEFLNYCKQCYLLHKNSQGGVEEPENYQEILESLRDQEVAEINDKILLKMSESFEFDEQGKILTVEVIKYVKDVDKANKFAVSNFETYLEADFGVKKEGKYYKGIRRK